MDFTKIREELAAIEHDRWSGWELYRETVKDSQHPSGEPNEERWRRQRSTPYAELTEAEKDSDRSEAEKTLAVIEPVIESLEKQRDQARALVLRLVVARYRDGWEEGESEEEIHSSARDSLYNWGLDPHNDREACREILERHQPEVSLAQCRSNQELADAARRELEDAESEVTLLLEVFRPLVDDLETANANGWLGEAEYRLLENARKVLKGFDGK